MKLLCMLMWLTAQLNIAILGDSNTWLGGDDCTNPKGWNTWFAREMPSATCYSYARSGATWTHTPLTRYNITENIGVIGDDNVITNQINRLVNDIQCDDLPAPDVVIISAGTNDVWFPDKRPSALDSLAATIRSDCQLLWRSFPDVRIVLLTPLQTTAVSLDTIYKIGDMIEACGRELDLAVIRQDKECVVRSADEKANRHYTYDGTHTSVEGAKANGAVIAKRVKQLLNGIF